MVDNAIFRNKYDLPILKMEFSAEWIYFVRIEHCLIFDVVFEAVARGSIVHRVGAH